MPSQQARWEISCKRFDFCKPRFDFSPKFELSNIFRTSETGLSRHIDAEVGSLEENAREWAHKNGIEAESSAKRTEADEGSLFSGFGRK